MRARTPEAALAVVLRLLVAQRLADTAGLPNADRQGVYEPQELAGSKVLDKLAKRVAPPSVKQHLAAQEAEREQREQAWRDEQAARLQEQRDKLAAGEADPLRMLPPHDRIGRRSRREGRHASSTPATANSNGAAPTTKPTTTRPTRRRSTRQREQHRPPHLLT